MRVLMNQEVLVLGSRWILATVIAYALAQYLGVFKGFFALITIAAVIQLTPSDTCIRSIMRITATLISAFLTYGLLSIANGHFYILIPGCLLITFFAGYAIFQSEVTRYFHTMFGIIMVNVLFFATLTDSHWVAAIEIIKLVSLGVISMLVTDLLLGLFTHQVIFSRAMVRDFITMFTTLADKEKRRSRAIIATQLCIAVAIALIPWLIWQYRDGFWVVISCFFVVEEFMTAVVLKSETRFFAHLVSAIVGGVIVLLAVQWPEVRFPLYLLCIFMICIFMINKKELALMGNTMGIALTIIVLGGENDAAIYRFIYTVLGIIVGLVVCAIFSKTRIFLKNHYVKNLP